MKEKIALKSVIIWVEDKFLIFGSVFLDLYWFHIFLFNDSSTKVVSKLFRLVGVLFFFEIVNHIIYNIRRTLINDSDHHFAQNGVNVGIDIL